MKVLATNHPKLLKAIGFIVFLEFVVFLEFLEFVVFLVLKTISSSKTNRSRIDGTESVPWIEYPATGSCYRAFPIPW